MSQMNSKRYPRRSLSGAPFILALLAVAIAGLCGCGSPASGPLNPLFNLELGPSVPPDVILAPGDQLDVKFFYAEELNELLQPIRPDGAISLQLVGDVIAQGKTPAELRQELRELYAPHLRIPEVAVIVRSLVNRKVYVGGQVNAPGLVEMPGQMTALEAIMHAGGFVGETAEPDAVVLIRHKDGQRYGLKLEFADALDGEAYQPFFLEPYDIIHVPETTIVKVTTWIDQHINQIIPVGFRATRNRGDTTVGLETGQGGTVRIR